MVNCQISLQPNCVSAQITNVTTINLFAAAKKYFSKYLPFRRCVEPFIFNSLSDSVLEKGLPDESILPCNLRVYCLYVPVKEDRCRRSDDVGLEQGYPTRKKFIWLGTPKPDCQANGSNTTKGVGELP